MIRNLLRQRYGFWIIFALAAALGVVAPASGKEAGPEEIPDRESAIPDAGPTSVESILKENDGETAPLFVLPWVDALLDPWIEFRQSLATDYGFALGMDYQALYQVASDSVGSDEAAGGAARLFFQWTVLDRGGDYPGSIVFKGEHRHNIVADTAPEGFAGELGYVGITGTGYGDFNLGVTDLYWKQQFWGAVPAEVRIGRLAPTAYFDVTLTSDPYTTFLNFSTTFTPTIAYPADGALGALAWVGLTDQLYIMGTALDANSSTTNAGFDDFEIDELFKGIELGWAARGARNSFVDNVHVSFWHTDERDEAGVDDGWGISATGSWLLGDDEIMPFVRLGWSDGGISLLERSAAVGIAGNLTARSDLAGVAFHWGRTAGPVEKHQYLAEMFYRLQLARNLALTPNLQLIWEPAVNPDEDFVAVFGLRLRTTF